jgi:hypothetical protein
LRRRRLTTIATAPTMTAANPTRAIVPDVPVTGRLAAAGDADGVGDAWTVPLGLVDAEGDALTDALGETLADLLGDALADALAEALGHGDGFVYTLSASTAHAE